MWSSCHGKTTMHLYQEQKQAEAQLRKQLQKLKHTPALLNKLDKQISAYEREGFIETVGEEERKN